jgi:hypothetical protein
VHPFRGHGDAGDELLTRGRGQPEVVGDRPKRARELVACGRADLDAQSFSSGA